MLQISDAYLTAAATVLGVLLTVTVQAITSATQRRHEGIARMFDIRLELYAKTRRAISDWSEQYQVTNQLKSELEANIKHVKNESATLATKIEDFVSKEPYSSGVVFDQPATVTQEAAKQLLRELEDHRARRVDIFEKMQKMQDIAAGHLEKLYAARDELQELSHKVALLASKPVTKLWRTCSKSR
jgi:predicted  nucleic acid-binding Zn-ribbon protein